MTEYVRVPREPTPEMLKAGASTLDDFWKAQERGPTHVQEAWPGIVQIYAAMLAVSPQGEGSPAEADQDALIERTCRECRALHRIFTEVVTPPASPQGEGGWTKHDGGPNPVPGKTVECKLAGTSFPMAALPSECLNWAADLRFGGSIIAYRVTEGVKP